MKKENQKALPLLALLLAAAAILLVFAAPARAGAKAGLALAENTVLPSLLMLFLMIQNTRAGVLLSRALTLPAKALRLPPQAAGALLFGQIGGYPTGAVLTGELLDRGVIDCATARRMLCFNVCGGVGFICTAVGTAVLHSGTAGWLLLTANILANLTVAAVTVPLSDPPAAKEVPPAPPLSAGEALPAAAKGAMESLLHLSACIILFSALCAVVPVPKWLLPLVEITAGLCTGTGYTLAQILHTSPSHHFPTGIITPISRRYELLGWAGRFELPYPTFLACRAGAALLADGYCRGLLRLFPQPAAVFSNISETLPRPGIGSTTLTALLLAGAVVFALDLLQRRRRVDWV